MPLWMMEMAYHVTPVCPSNSPSIRIQDGISYLRLSFSGVNNLHLNFTGGASVSFGYISSFRFYWSVIAGKLQT